MEFSFTEEQELLRKTARDVLQRESPTSLVREMEESAQGYSPELWRTMAGLGWLGLPLPEAHGGAGGSFLDLAILLEELGRALAPVPFFSSVVLGGLPIARFGSDAQREAILPTLATGDAMLTFALMEPFSTFGAQAVKATVTRVDGGFRLTGQKAFVENAHTATHILCPARLDDGVGVFIVDGESEGLSKEQLTPISLERMWDLSLTDVFVPENRLLGSAETGASIVKQTLRWAIAGQCAQSLGGAQSMLERTVEYAKQRVQFGKPIGSFQAVQHHAANIYSDVETIRLIAYEAVWLLSEDRPCDEEVAMAKAWVSTAYPRLTRTCIQIHGGVGLSKEVDAQLYFRRAKAWEPLFGSVDHHRGRIAQGMKP